MGLSQAFGTGRCMWLTKPDASSIARLKAGGSQLCRHQPGDRRNRSSQVVLGLVNYGGGQELFDELMDGLARPQRCAHSQPKMSAGPDKPYRQSKCLGRKSVSPVDRKHQNECAIQHLDIVALAQGFQEQFLARAQLAKYDVPRTR